VEVAGDFCPAALETCLKWIDVDNPRGPNVCAEFAAPTRCLSQKKQYIHVCIDRYEWPNVVGALPSSRVSWIDAKRMCTDNGKRLCTSEEWTFACEGRDMKPYSYGYVRDETACNTGRKWIDPWVNDFEIVDKRDRSGAHPKCVSDFGTFDQLGNADEWVFNTEGFEHRSPWISGLMGGHWVGGIHNRCRYMTVSHEPGFQFYVTGFRCCVSPANE
jgi:formylglycine-generating enzyme